MMVQFTLVICYHIQFHIQGPVINVEFIAIPDNESIDC